MANQKISQLNPISGSNVDDATDVLAIVDTSAAETKKISREELFKSVGAITVSTSFTVGGTAFTVDGISGDVSLGGDLNVSGGSTVDGSLGVGETTPDARFTVSRLGASRTGAYPLDPGAGVLVHPGAATSGSGSTVQISGNDTSECKLLFGDTLAADSGGVVYDHSLDELTIRSGGNDTVVVDSVGNMTTLGQITSGSQFTFSDGTVSGVFGSGTSDMNIATTSNHAIDIRPNNTRSMLLFPNGVKNFYNADGSTVGVSISGSGFTGFGTSSPNYRVHISGDSTPMLVESSTTDVFLGFKNTGSTSDFATRIGAVGQELVFHTNTAERVRIDSSGNVGIDTAPQTPLHVNSATNPSPSDVSTEAKGTLFLSGVGALVGDGNLSSSVSFSGNNTSRRRAMIAAYQDGVDGDPTGLKFYTYVSTAASSDAVSERMTLDAAGNLGLSVSNPSAKLHSQEGTGISVFAEAVGATYASDVLLIRASRAASTAFDLIDARTSSGSDTKFRVRADGEVTADGAFTGGGADYAEYFEWALAHLEWVTQWKAQKGHIAGISVVVEGGKIRPANQGEEPIGVISANASVVGDGDNGSWKGKYLRDDFGADILEEYQVVSWTDQGENHEYVLEEVPTDLVIPEDAEYVVQTRQKLNPEYNPDLEYTPREERVEWDTVGLVGKLRVIKGQPVGSRWIKLKDISDNVEEWLVR